MFSPPSWDWVDAKGRCFGAFQPFKTAPLANVLVWTIVLYHTLIHYVFPFLFPFFHAFVTLNSAATNGCRAALTVANLKIVLNIDQCFTSLQQVNHFIQILKGLRMC